MQLTKFSVIFVLLTARPCRAKIVIATSKPDKLTSILVEDLINIVTTCYGDRIKGIGVAGYLPVTLIRTLSARHIVPVGLINNTYQLGVDREKIPVQFQQKLPVFIVEASSFRQLDRLFQGNIEYSMWWNHMASFFIFDMSPKCSISDDYLYLAWQRNILNAKVICYWPKIGTIVLTFNPFTGRAPISWHRYTVFPGVNKHPFTVFSRVYKDKTICVDLDFENTKNLGGYVINVEGWRPRPARNSGRATDRLCSRDNNILDTIYNAVNARLKYSRKNRSPFPKAGKAGTYPDIGFESKMMRNAPDSVSYPHEEIGFVILTQYRSHKSLLNQILSVIDGNSQLGTGIVFFITLIFFKFFVRQALLPTFLNLIRIICNRSFTNLPGNTASRIYLACLLFYAVVMHGIYQSKLASLRTINIPLPNVNTIQDLVDYDYKEICVTMHDAIIVIDHPVLQQRCTKLNKLDDCVTKVKHDLLTAFFGPDQYIIFDEAREFNLHMNSKSIHTEYLSFKVRWDWPLEERVNIIIQKCVEADIITPLPVKYSLMKFTGNTQDFKSIELGQFTFAFVILGIGLMCATITLIIELAIQYEYVCRFKMLITDRRQI